MKKLKIRMPPYVSPRNAWRRLIYAEVKDACTRQGIRYNITDKLDIEVVLYLKDNELDSHDIDNRLKDVMDALQERLGGPKARKRTNPIIQNDKQVYRLIGEKKPPPKQSRGLGHLMIRKYKEK